MLQEAIKYNIECQPKIRDICSHIEKYFNISLIHYRRFYLNRGGLISLFNHNQWMEVSFEKQFWYSSVLCQKLQSLLQKKNLTYLWPSSPINDPIYQGLYDHNLWNGITLYKKHIDCIESYAFATTRENTKATDFYLSEINILEHFILYFRSRMLPLLSGTIEKNIMIPCQLNLSLSPAHEDNKENFFKDTPVNAFYIRVEGADIKLTKREEECLDLLSTGMKVKDIANILKLSSRTIESYIEHAKIKTCSSTTSQLLRLHQKAHICDKI